MKLYSVDNLDSLVDFFDLVVVYVSLRVFLGLPFYISLVYSLGAMCSFFIYILLFTDQKNISSGVCLTLYPIDGSSW